MMLYSKLDLFSSHFSFNTGNHQNKRGTLFGTILSLGVFIITMSYFIYIIQQYITNQIEPVFRSQSFINNDLIEVPMNSDLVGFRFEYGNQNQQELQKNKTYLVYLAFYFYASPDNNQFIPLDVIDCTNSDLLGFKCLDFSKISNYTLSLDTKQNQKSSIQILTYGCLDIDTLKTSVPDNCAEQTEIDNMINGVNSVLRFKLYTSQYNTTSQKVQINYRNAYVYTIASQSIITQLKTQQQNTSIKEGLIVQSQSTFSSPIQYTQQDLSYDRQYALNHVGAGAYNVALLLVDEIVQQIQIQYPTLPQVFALVNSIFTLMMLLGIFGRMVSQSSIQKDFLMLFLKNIYQESYLQITKSIYNQGQQITSLKNSDQINDVEQKQQTEKDQNDCQEKDQNAPSIFIPALISKSKTVKEFESQNNIDNQLRMLNNLKRTNNLYATQDLTVQMTDQHNQDKQNSLANTYSEEVDSIIQDGKGYQQKNGQRESVSPSISYNPSFIKTNFIIRKTFSQQIQTKKEKIQIDKQKNQDIQSFKNSNSSQTLFNTIFNNNYLKKEQIQDLDQIQLQKIQFQIKKDLNILNFVKDIIFLKKAIMMILSPDQLAALQIVGCSSDFLDINLISPKLQLDELEKSKQISHYEMQYAILYSNKFQQQYIDNFLRRTNQNIDTNTIDQRILSSIKKCHKF